MRTVVEVIEYLPIFVCSSQIDINTGMEKCLDQKLARKIKHTFSVIHMDLSVTQ
jgi:hypothetical protein